MVIFDKLRNIAFSVADFSQSLRQRQSRYYMQHGAGRRLMMIWRAFKSVIFTAPANRVDPLNNDEQIAISLDLNVIYMHLRGVLDNYAWCIGYEKFPEKANRWKPMQVDLFGGKLQPLLASLDTYEAIKQHADWNKDVKERRDPVAHRIPLYVPPAVHTPSEAARYSHLRNEWFDLCVSPLCATDEVHEKLDDLVDLMERIGRFSPYFMHHPEHTLISIYPTVPTDLAHLIQITEIVLTALHA